MIQRLQETQAEMVASKRGRRWNGGEQGMFPAGTSEDYVYHVQVVVLTQTCMASPETHFFHSYIPKVSVRLKEVLKSHLYNNL